MIDGSFPAIVESMQSVTLLRECIHTRAGVCFFFTLEKHILSNFDLFFIGLSETGSGDKVAC